MCSLLFLRNIMDFYGFQLTINILLMLALLTRFQEILQDLRNSLYVVDVSLQYKQ